MDPYVERQVVEKLRQGETKQFLLLFDASFEKVYKYVYRRVVDHEEAERITRLVFLDALTRTKNTPVDTNFLVWLFKIAKGRVWDFMNHPSYQVEEGANILPVREGLEAGDAEFVKRGNKMFGKLSLEEREILRLKFFEELSDGDVMVVIGAEEGVIGPKIYKVLKRAHFLLFGESDERQGVYFGELSGFLARIRDLEEIMIEGAKKLNIRLDLEKRIERKDFAIDAELVKEGSEKKVVGKGSDDPAKVFVQAVKEMKEEEEQEKMREREIFERKRRVVDFFDRWKIVLGFVPAALVVLFVGSAFFSALSFPVERGYPTVCSVEVNFDGDFADGEMRELNQRVSDRLCERFDVSNLSISKIENNKVEVSVDVPEWMLEYDFERRSEDWRINKYARTINSNG